MVPVVLEIYKKTMTRRRPAASKEETFENGSPENRVLT